MSRCPICHRDELGCDCDLDRCDICEVYVPNDEAETCRCGKTVCSLTCFEILGDSVICADCCNALFDMAAA